MNKTFTYVFVALLVGAGVFVFQNSQEDSHKQAPMEGQSEQMPAEHADHK